MSNRQIKVTFKTLTPLWTGDAWGKCNELKLTGLIGSLRWWFEVLVRGMGYKACDSTGDNKCQVEIKSFEDVLNIHNKICPVCYLFGTTGWKSRFQVKIEDEKLSRPYNGRVIVEIGKRSNKWYYEPGLIGQATLIFQYEDISIGKIEENEKTLTMKDVFPSILKILFYLISEYGMLGAKTSMGYGVINIVRFKIDEKDELISSLQKDWEKLENYLRLFNNKFQRNINYLPNLKDFFFVKFNVGNSIDRVINNVKEFFSYQDGIIETDVIDKWKDKNWCITSPVVRKCLRCVFRGKYSKRVCVNNKSCLRNYWWNYYNENDSRNKANTKYNANLTIDRINITEREAQNIRHFLMGSTSEPEFSAIQVSHVYSRNNNLEFRIYGWLPDFCPIKDKINDILELLQEIFQDFPWKDNALLPSKIQPGISWDSSNNKLSLVNNKIKSLFNISGGSDL